MDNYYHIPDALPVPQKVVTHLKTPISNFSVHIATIIHTDGTHLHVFNAGGESAEVVVSKAQALLTTWHEVLRLTSGYLKLNKCYCTL